MLAMQQNFCWWENRSVASNLVKVGGITPSFKHSCHNFKMALVGGGGGGWCVAFTVCGSLSLYLLQLDINLIKVPPYSSFSSSSAPPYTWRISTQTCLQFAAESNVRVWPYLGQGRLLWRTKLHQVSLSISKYFQNLNLVWTANCTISNGGTGGLVATSIEIIETVSSTIQKVLSVFTALSTVMVIVWIDNKINTNSIQSINGNTGPCGSGRVVQRETAEGCSRGRRCHILRHQRHTFIISRII